VDEFTAYLEIVQVCDPQAIRLIHLNGFLAELDKRGLSGTSRRRKTFALKTFFDFLELHEYVTMNVAHRLIPPESEERTPRVLDEDEYKRLKLTVTHEPRDAAIVELLLQTGIRLGELARLTLADVKLPTKITPDPTNTGELYIRQGKGRKDRVLSLNHKVCRALKTYLMVRPPLPSPALFTSKFQRPITPRGYEWILAKHLKAAGIRNASVHTLRHTFGTHMVKSGSNLRTVQEMMGHADLKTTSLYVSLARDMMNKDVQEHAL
jgi:site-specific recombinase XerD